MNSRKQLAQLSQLPLQPRRRLPRINPMTMMRNFNFQRLPRSAPKPRSKPFTFDRVGEELLRACSQALHNPMVLITILLAVVVVFSDVTDLDHGPLAHWFPKDSTQPFVIWVRKNIQKIIGMAVFLPVVVDLPRRMMMLVVIIPLIVVILPPVPTFEYALLAILTHFFLHVNGTVARLVVIAVGVFLYLAGVILSGFHPGRYHP